MSLGYSRVLVYMYENKQRKATAPTVGFKDQDECFNQQQRHLAEQLKRFGVLWSSDLLSCPSEHPAPTIWRANLLPCASFVIAHIGAIARIGAIAHVR